MTDEPRPAARRYRLLDAARVGMAAIERLTDEVVHDWDAPTPNEAWNALLLARHLHAIAADYLQWVDDARAEIVHPLLTGHDLASHNEARMLSLPMLRGPTHVVAMLGHADRHLALADRNWDLPVLVTTDGAWTVGEHVGVAAIEWHVHAWDLARSQGDDHRPGDTEVLADVWSARLSGPTGRPLGDDDDAWHAVLRASGRDPAWRVSGGDTGPRSGGEA